MQLIWEYSEGIPRKINVLCDNALLIGYGTGVKKITFNIIEEAIKDLCWSPFLSPDETQVVRIGDSETKGEKSTLYLSLWILIVSLLLAGCIAIAAWLFMR